MAELGRCAPTRCTCQACRTSLEALGPGYDDRSPTVYLPMTSTQTLRINRAPVLTLWAAVVAERLGMPRETALTAGHALAGITAHAKGVRLGIYEPPGERPREASPPLPKGVKKSHAVELPGRRIHVADTPDGQRAISKGELVKPEAVERNLGNKFGDALGLMRTEMERLAVRFSPERLNQEGFHLYEQFRPEVPTDERGWGAKGVLDVAKIRAPDPRGGSVC